MEMTIGDENPAVVILPGEIVIEILTFLPVKPLLKFRCISKSWRSLISSPSFTKSHLLQVSSKKASFSSFTNRHRIMLIPLEPLTYLKDLSMHSLIEHPLIDASVPIDCPEWKRIFSLTVVGSDNGLICINAYDRCLIVWNSTTRVHTTVEIDPLDWFTCMTVNAFGFGYSNATEDYMFLGFFSSGNNKTLFVKIYSVKDRSWKKLEGYNYNTVGPLHRLGKLVNGKLHFKLFPAGKDNKWEIVSFDLDAGTHGIIEESNYVNGRGHDKNDSSTVGVLSGCLCVLFVPYFDTKESGLNLWVLKEYGVKESWKKLFKIITAWIRASLTPLVILPTGEIGNL